MYLQEKLDEEYCTFLRREVAPRVRALPIYGDYVDIGKKKELLELLGIERILVENEMRPVAECSDFHINLAIGAIGSEIKSYFARFAEAKKEREKPKERQLQLPFSGAIQCGRRDDRNAALPEDMRWIHSRRD
jgi:hypothetical protein